MHNRISYPIFLDIEASGLDKASYPIEIAWNDAKGNITSFIIKPHPEWTYWSDEAEKLHRIYREELEESGITLNDACDRLDAELSGRGIYSDAPFYEKQWLDKLYQTANRRRPFAILGISRIPLFRKAFLRHAGQTTYELYKKQAFKELGDRHRASIDVKAMMRIYDLCEQNS